MCLVLKSIIEAEINGKVEKRKAEVRRKIGPVMFDLFILEYVLVICRRPKSLIKPLSPSPCFHLVPFQLYEYSTRYVPGTWYQYRYGIASNE